MAESVVSFVLDKLAILLEEKVNLVKNVKQEVEYIRDELERMIAFLRVADAEEYNDPELEVWVKQVRDVAYETEDIIDDFMLQSHLKNDRFLGKLILCVPNTGAQLEIASGIQNIKSRIIEIAEGHRRYSYRFNVPGEVSTPRFASNRGIDRRGDALLLEETEIVGIENPKRQLIRWLVEGESRFKVVSVVGMGGMGKTTLIKKVYDDFVVKKHFQNHAWITVSQSFVVEELLKDTIQQLFDQMKQTPPENFKSMDGNRLKAIIKDFLRERRYVLVFDDVWSILAWEAIRYALPNENNGSRVILTTRLMDVALSCSKETDGYVYELNPLSEEESWILFSQKTFRGNPCPTHLIEICKSILKRCGGLPLAIVAISGVLSTKNEINVDEWKKLNCSLGSELEGNDKLESIRIILSLSFNYLPYYLKPCFLYLGNYPEDHQIEHKTLVRQWIAEGYVKQKVGRSVEEVAQGYLNELVNRSLLSPVTTNDDGSIKTSRIHDFYRQIILPKSRDQNFVTSTNELNITWPRRVRQLSVHGSFKDTDVKRCGTRLCSFLSFHVEDPQSILSILQLLKSCRMLKVLDLRGVPLEKFPEAVLELFHLRYLSLRSTKIKSLPRSIKKLQKLEILDLKETYINELPVEILKLQNLRHLLVYRHVPGSYLPYDYVHGFKVFKGMGRLKFLQKLGFVDAYPGSIALKEIAMMTELRRISITKLRTEDGVALCLCIEKLQKLCSLGLRSIEGDVLDLSHLSSPPLSLQRLYLTGRLANFPKWIRSLPSLVKVYFRWSQLSDDPLEYLQDLPNLVHIEFLASYVGKTLCFKAGKFPKLKLLGLDKLETLSQVIIEEGAMPHLEKLIIQRCNSLKGVPEGIKRLADLKVLEFFDMPDQFIVPLSPEKLGEDYWKIAHIPEVYHTYWRNGCWEVHPLDEKQGTEESEQHTATIVRTQEQRNWL
ncbi:Disease resistance protein RPM1 [Abeliophyllum distichum]|uniref:Disease resistance protein RPM1 n=1 Tax=Abeliophyllum distichum TaxID=126358 RepID=A0ABD1RSZ3_9LAMI